MMDEVAKEIPPDPGMEAEGGTTGGALKGAEDGKLVALACAPPDEQVDLTEPVTPPPE